MRLVSGRHPGTGQDTPAAVAMGFFDGVHIGHAAVVNTARAYAEKHGLRLAVFTYGAGPKSGGKLICTEAQKLALLEQLGVDTCYQPSFGQFSALSPTAFVTDMLMEEYNAKAIFCGQNFAFGAGRAGNTALLEDLCRQHGLALGVVPMADYAGQPVSSTRIRAALAKGRMEDVNAMLGRPYTASAPVVHGRGLGHTLGFPTLNQSFPKELQPPAFGVYVTQTLVNGAPWPSATGYGTRPTVDGGLPSCETFIPGYTGDLYGKTLQVAFYKKIADTQRFESMQALADAVQNWARQAQSYFA